MNFSTDSDLLALEPRVFTELPIVAQTKLIVDDAAINGRTVSSATGGFHELQPGDVALFDDAAFTIASVPDTNSLTLATTPFGVTTATMTVRTFESQRTLIHERIMRAIGINPNDESLGLDESAVLSLDVLRRAEMLGTLGGAYRAGFSILGDNSGLREKAERYESDFNETLRGAVVRIDTDGDGEANVIRRPGIGILKRM